jgi:hypothetical protein
MRKWDKHHVEKAWEIVKTVNPFLPYEEWKVELANFAKPTPAILVWFGEVAMADDERLL